MRPIAWLCVAPMEFGFDPLPGGGLIVMPDAFNDVIRELIIALAARYSVPAIYYNRFFSEPGGLISYGELRVETFRLARVYRPHPQG